MDIEIIRQYLKCGTVLLSQHVTERLEERGIELEDLENGILNGEIIEDYPDTKPFPSCLILGYTNNHKAIHICIAYDNMYILYITAYWPSLDKWQDDYKTRKKKEV